MLLQKTVHGWESRQSQKKKNPKDVKQINVIRTEPQWLTREPDRADRVFWFSMPPTKARGFIWIG